MNSTDPHGSSNAPNPYEIVPMEIISNESYCKPQVVHISDILVNDPTSYHMLYNKFTGDVFVVPLSLVVSQPLLELMLKTTGTAIVDFSREEMEFAWNFIYRVEYNKDCIGVCLDTAEVFQLSVLYEMLVANISMGMNLQDARLVNHIINKNESLHVKLKRAFRTKKLYVYKYDPKFVLFLDKDILTMALTWCNLMGCPSDIILTYALERIWQLNNIRSFAETEGPKAGYKRMMKLLMLCTNMTLGNHTIQLGEIIHNHLKSDGRTTMCRKKWQEFYLGK
jgi:hypothetical protein